MPVRKITYDQMPPGDSTPGMERKEGLVLVRRGSGPTTVNVPGSA